MWCGPLGKDSSRSSINAGFLWAFFPLLPLPLSPSLLLSPSSCEQSPGTRLGNTSLDCFPPHATPRATTGSQPPARPPRAPPHLSPWKQGSLLSVLRIPCGGPLA